MIRRWIAQGAIWPADVDLKAGTATAGGRAAVSGASGERAAVAEIRDRILANQKNPPGTKTYKITIPNTTVSYDMIEVPAGDFEMGSTGKPDEQPVHKVSVPAFWMQAHEVTWDEYRLFMFANQAGEVAHKDETVDAVSRPTRPYVEMSFGMGINGFPAISMTQHAANKYAEWLSAKTGEFYRLPTEAEWEYACRAGIRCSLTPLNRLRLVLGRQLRQISKGRNEEAECLGSFRHAWQRHGVDARRVLRLIKQETRSTLR